MVLLPGRLCSAEGEVNDGLNSPSGRVGHDGKHATRNNGDLQCRADCTVFVMYSLRPDGFATSSRRTEAFDPLPTLR